MQAEWSSAGLGGSAYPHWHKWALPQSAARPTAGCSRALLCQPQGSPKSCWKLFQLSFCSASGKQAKCTAWWSWGLSWVLWRWLFFICECWLARNTILMQKKCVNPDRWDITPDHLPWAPSWPCNHATRCCNASWERRALHTILPSAPTQLSRQLNVGNINAQRKLMEVAHGRGVAKPCGPGGSCVLPEVRTSEIFESYTQSCLSMIWLSHQILGSFQTMLARWVVLPRSEIQCNTVWLEDI